MNDEYSEFRRKERYEETVPLCYHCGCSCSGDVTETVMIDGQSGEVTICDDPDTCPANKEQLQ